MSSAKAAFRVLKEVAKGRLAGEPEAKDMESLMRDAVKDASSVSATLMSIGQHEAKWRLESGEEIRVGTGWDSQYGVLDSEEFENWLSLAFKTLTDSGREPNRLSIPGKLCVSKTAILVLGWQEQEDHPDACLLSIGEIMSS